MVWMVKMICVGQQLQGQEKLHAGSRARMQIMVQFKLRSVHAPSLTDFDAPCIALSHTHLAAVMTSVADNDSAATAQAYLEWVRAVGSFGDESQQGIAYSRSVEKVEDLSDGVVLFDIMSSM